MARAPWSLRAFRGATIALLLVALLTVLLVAPPIRATSTLLPLPRTEGGGGPHALEWGNTSILTTDPRVANNTELNFTLAMDPGSLSSQKNLTVVMSEVMGTVGIVQFGFTALDDDGPTGVNPVLVLPNGTWIDGPTTLLTSPSTGILSDGWEHAHGWWWTATDDGAAWAGPRPWENGTYLMNTSFARAIVVEAGSVVSGPSLIFREGGPTLPLPLFIFAVPDVFWVQNGSSVILPDNGELLGATPATFTVPFTGHNQSSSVPADEVFSPGLEETSANEATLWGNFSHRTQLSSTLVGAYTEDPAFAANDTTGISLACGIPPPLPAGQVAVQEVALPINASTVVDLGFSSLTFLQAPFTFPEVGVFTNDGKDHTIYLDIGDPEEEGEPANIVLQEVKGPWWNVSVTGQFGMQPFSAMSGVGGSGTSNGTFDLGVASAWGVSSRPFYSNGSFATQPTFFFSGNLSSLSFDASFELREEDGNWVPPSSVAAWSLGKGLEDILLGPLQNGTLPTSTVSVTNSTISHPAPLANGTVLWSTTPTVAGHLTSGPLRLGVNSTLEVWVNDSRALPDQLLLSAVSSLRATISDLAYAASSGAFLASYTTPALDQTAVDVVTISALIPGLEFLVNDSLSVDLEPEAQVEATAGFVSGATTLSLAWGTATQVFVNATGAGGAPLVDASIQLTSNATGAAWGTVQVLGRGDFEVSYTPALHPGVEGLGVKVFAPDSLPTPSLELSLTVLANRSSSPCPCGPGTNGTATARSITPLLELTVVAVAMLLLLLVAGLRSPARKSPSEGPGRRGGPRTPGSKPSGPDPLAGSAAEGESGPRPEASRPPESS